MGTKASTHGQVPFRLNALKLAPPAAALQAISREGVCSAICNTSATLSLLCAPAGFGKTTAMSQAYRELQDRGSPVAWLSLAPADNEIARLSIYLIAALRSVIELSFDPSEINDARGDFASANVRTYQLLEELPLIGTGFVLFIDELEHITDFEALRFVERLIGALDPGQRLVIGSRRSPNLHLGRLRVQGRLQELGIEALRFSETETGQFVRARLPSVIDDNEIRHLHGRTDGWPAALQLAAMATLLGKPGGQLPPKDISGSIADFLAEDVLDRLPQEQRTFLQRSSIFEMFCPEMCDAVFATTDSAAWIQKTLAENLFLNKIDADGDWYRYHPLFHEFLQKECALTFRNDVRGFHAKAANWLGTAGRTGLAIDHAIIASEYELAADLIEQCAMRYVRTGQMKAVCGWIARLPEEAVIAHPRLMIAGAYANTYLHKYREAGELIAKLDVATLGTVELADDLLLIRIMLAVWTDNIGNAFEISLANQDKLASGDPYAIGLIQNVIAYSHAFHGYYFFAHQSIATAKRALMSVNALHALTYSTWLEGALSLLQGDALDAHARASASLAQVVNAGQKYSSASPVAAVNFMEVLYEINDLERIEALVDDYLPLIRETCIPDHAIIAHRIAARLYALSGRQAQALEVLNTLQDLGDARSIPRFSAAARLDRIWIASVAGDLSTVNRLLPLVTTESIWKPFHGLWTHAEDIDDAQIATFRYALLSGDAASATTQIEVAVRQAEAGNRRRRVFRLQCLLAQAHELARRRQRALDILERTLVAAHSLGLIRVFADEAWCLLPLLEALALRDTAIPQDYLFRLMEAVRKNLHSHRGSSAPEQPADAILSPRERQILNLVAEGFSNKELAARVLVAESTVETFLHRINTKLGTRNRTQAVARGRDLKLI